MRLLRRLFKPKQTEAAGDRSLCRLLAMSVICIFVCTVCLCGASWAWFTAGISSGTFTIQLPTYTVSYTVDSADPTVIAAESVTYSMTGDSQKITLTASGTEGATGYCVVTIGDKSYYTGQIAVNGSFSFTVKGKEGT